MTTAPTRPAARSAARPAPRSTLDRRRAAGHHPTPFRDRRILWWLAAGVAGLVVLAVAPLAWPPLAQMAQRAGTLLSLVFLVAAACLGAGMRRRAFPVAGAVVLVLYGLSVPGTLALDVHDFFVVAVLAGFAVFALAGFNLVFVLEEAVYDAHRLLHLRSPVWTAVPTLLVATVAVALPWWSLRGGPPLGATWGGAVVGLVLLGGWWILRAFNDLPGRRVVPDLHLFVFALLGATALLDLVGLLGRGGDLLPSLAAYIVLVGTWVYVSYTTLQRTQFLLGGRNTLPWVSLLLAASYAILVHVQIQYRAVPDPGDSIATLLRLRVGYMAVGIWIGLAFYLLRGLWGLLRTVRHLALLGRRGRVVAGGAARVAEDVVRAERRLGHLVGDLLWGVEAALPGRREQRPRGWDLDAEGLEPIEDE